MIVTDGCKVEIFHMDNELEKINKMIEEEMEPKIIIIHEEYEKKIHDVILWVS